MAHYKLVAVDLDGTLLNGYGALTPRTQTAIQAIRQQGVHFVVSTGRPLQGMEWIVDIIGADAPLILFNGALVLSRVGGDTVFARNLRANDARAIWQLSNIRDITTVFWCEEKLYTNRRDEYSQAYSKISGVEPIVVSSIDEYAEAGIVKFVWLDEPARILKAQDQIDGTLPDSTVFHTSRPWFLEFVDSEVSKGLSLSKLGEYLNVGPSETMAIGDGENDLSMIRYAGCGVVVENASEHIREEADFITRSNDDDGVAYALEQLILVRTPS